MNTTRANSIHLSHQGFHNPLLLGRRDDQVAFELFAEQSLEAVVVQVGGTAASTSSRVVSASDAKNLAPFFE